MLDKLGSALCPVQEGQRTILTLHGVAGSGKTELACKFCRSRRTEFDLIYQVSGRSKDEFTQDMLALQEKVTRSFNHLKTGNAIPELEATTDQLFERLNQTGNFQWLLIIDDARFNPISDDCTPSGIDAKLFWIRHVNRIKQGTVLITSQYDCSHHIGKGLELPGFTEDKSMDLLRKLTGVNDSNSEKGIFPYPNVSFIAVTTR